MPHIPICSTAEASRESLTVYEEFHTLMLEQDPMFDAYQAQEGLQ